jgi:hypothetical protein
MILKNKLRYLNECCCSNFDATITNTTSVAALPAKALVAALATVLLWQQWLE